MSFSSNSFITLCFSLEFVVDAQVDIKSGNASLRNVNFVENIKENLRRDNEDYKEIKHGNNLNSDDQKDNALKNNRRAYVDSSEYNYEDNDKYISKNLQVLNNATVKAVYTVKEVLRTEKVKVVKKIYPKIINKIKVINTVEPPVTIKTISTSTNQTQTALLRNDKKIKIPTFVKRNKIDKYKKFMDKNKGLLKEFLSSKMLIPTEQTTVSNVLRLHKLDLDKIGDSVQSLENLGKALGLRNNGKYENMNHIMLPSPDLLDMAPARGGQIHKKRVKGRLCQRHVLLPEGPKYDSLGKGYVPHKQDDKRPYNATRHPKLLLPHCCNCCKKSVLGCE